MTSAAFRCASSAGYVSSCLLRTLLVRFMIVGAWKISKHIMARDHVTKFEKTTYKNGQLKAVRVLDEDFVFCTPQLHL